MTRTITPYAAHRGLARTARPAAPRHLALACALALVTAPLAARDGDPAMAFADAGVQRIAFNTGGASNDLGLAVAIQADGRIVIGGLASGPSGTYDFAVARLDADGSLDTGFGTGGRVRTDFALGGVDDSVRALAVQADGRIVAAGRAAATDAGNDRWLIGLARYTTGGAPDLGFDLDGRRVIDLDPGGTIAVDTIGLGVRADGRLVVAGTLLPIVNATLAFARLEADGRFDTSFNGNGRRLVTLAAPVIAQAMAMRADGRLLVAGAVLDAGFGTADMMVAQFDANGSPDAFFGDGGLRRIAFDQGGGDLDVARALVIDAQGRVLVAGEAQVATSGAVQRHMAVARLAANGTLDPSFGSGGRVLVPLQRAGIDIGGRAHAVAIDGAGRIVVAGEGGRDDASDDRDVVVARLTVDGELDERFGDQGRRVVRVDLGPPSNTSDGLAAMAIDERGRLVGAGSVFVGAGSTSDNDLLAVVLLGDTLLENGFD